MTFALELGKEDKSLGAQGAGSCVREEIGKDTSRARPLARAALSARRDERSTMPVGVSVRRRKPKRVLGELGGGDRCRAGARESRGVLENSGDLGVRALRRKREVVGAVERIRDNDGETSVCAPSLVSRYAVVDGRREQRVREANRPVCSLDHARGKGAIEYGLGDIEACEELGRRTSHGRCEQQRRSRCRWQLIEACANQPLQCLRNTQRLHGVDVRAQSPGELERVERVTTGGLVHT